MRRYPLRIEQLNRLFLLLGLSLLAGLGLYAHLSLERVAGVKRQEEAAMAQREIAAAVAALEQRLKAIAQQLAAWDETRQHLANPEYYVLWRDGRVRETGLVPASMQVALYRPNGRILARDPQWAMPEALPDTGAGRARLQTAQGRTLLYYVFPVRVQADVEIVLGHAVLRLDPIAELRRHGPYRFVNADSLYLNAPDGTRLDVADLSRHIAFDPLPNPALDALLAEARGLTMVAIALALLLLLFVMRLQRLLLTRPLRRLTADIAALRDAPTSDVAPIGAQPYRLLELEQLKQAFADYRQRLNALLREMRHTSDRFYRQARQDGLTGVHNRRAFDEDRQQLEQDKRVSRCVLLLFDCDHFKAINDTYGHPVGDAVIRGLAQCLTQALRADDRLYRMGGDEFATLMPGAEIDTALKVAERCLEQVQRHDFRQYGVHEPISISIGLAHGVAPIDLIELHKQADLAMYAAKQPGHAKIVVYDDALGDLASLVHNRDVSAVYEAIRQPALIAFRYQPVVSLPALQREYVEALCRIEYDGQVIGPAAIFAIVQARRLDVEFDLAVIRAIRRDLAAGLPELRQGVSINLSGPGVVSDKVIQALIELKGDHPACKIVVEITETALITQLAVATANIERLRQAGCLVALDDFGSGYSSLRYLVNMPVDMVKFDMALIHLLIKGDPRQVLLVEDIAEIVVTAGYALVAEGVENETLLAKVKALGFGYAQGYHLDALQERSQPDAIATA